jgi:hypothetical protein
LIPISIFSFDLAFLADFVVDFIEPLVQVLVIEEVELFVVLLELDFCDFGIGDIRFGRRRKFDSIDHITQDLSYLLLKDLFLDIAMESTSFVLPLIEDEGPATEFDIGDLGL